jgi:hypothetical protein
MTETIYTCPMHPEVQLRGPGTCPKCGMKLEPKTATRSRSRAQKGTPPAVPGHHRR